MEFVGLAKFKVKAGVSDNHLLEAEKDIREVMKLQSGFISRELGKFEDGFWIVTIRWASKEDGSKWTQNSKQYKIVQQQHQMLDFLTMRMEFYQVKTIN
jgi:heme-degrading monooxygenase HmoA